MALIPMLAGREAMIAFSRVVEQREKVAGKVGAFTPLV
jgi:hypothetical protein